MIMELLPSTAHKLLQGDVRLQDICGLMVLTVLWWWESRGVGGLGMVGI